MQQLSDTELAFLDRRRRLVRWWTPALLSMLVTLAGTWLVLYARHPALADPFFVADAVKAGTLSAASMRLSAVLLPVLVGFLFFVVAVMLCYLHLAIRNERRYHALIGKLR